ncbi:MAG: glycosyltransferase [Ignavibacteriaceae bacterium]|nr:glycosyltransferase [Ignavibacteriaceae bacterium]
MYTLPIEVQKYFKKKLSGKWKIEITNPKIFNNIIVIPAIAELDNIKILLKSLAVNDKKYFNTTLILFVINHTYSASPGIKDNNEKTIKYLRNIVQSNSLEENFYAGLNIAFIDACSGGNELDNKNGGVGLARKIGMDLALEYFDYNLSSKNILICLDADCEVAENYITSVIEYFNTNKVDAAVINYEHNIREYNENTKAIICYELYLRYYLLGLTFAESPYAFHTIGSTMVCDYKCYIKVGGMNKLKAAEDFYFLEKLSKITDVGTVKSTSVYPSSRPSFRVPFGTGQRVNRFLLHTQNEYLLYNPQSFVVLKYWFELYNKLKDSDISKIMSQIQNINPHLFEFLHQQKFEIFWQKIISQKLNEGQIIKQKKYWFDAFKTLKLIHFLKDKSFPQINMFDAIDSLLALAGIENTIERNKTVLPDLDIQKEYLLLLRKLQNK